MADSCLALNCMFAVDAVNWHLVSVFDILKSCEAVAGPGSRFKGKHSLDSDEEDDEEVTDSSKYNILASDDVEGMYQDYQQIFSLFLLFLLIFFTQNFENVSWRVKIRKNSSCLVRIKCNLLTGQVLKFSKLSLIMSLAQARVMLGLKQII